MSGILLRQTSRKSYKPCSKQKPRVTVVALRYYPHSDPYPTSSPSRHNYLEHPSYDRRLCGDLKIGLSFVWRLNVVIVINKWDIRTEEEIAGMKGWSRRYPYRRVRRPPRKEQLDPGVLRQRPHRNSELDADENMALRGFRC